MRLLAHLVRSEYLGQGDRLKAYSIGLDIFDKPSEFDPAADSVVRVEMGRLRTALALFEASEFSDTRIVVDIPVGTYRPTITLRNHPNDPAEPDTPLLGPRPKKVRAVAKLAMLAVVVIAAVFLAFGGDKPPPATSPTIGIQISVVEPSDASVRDVKSALARALLRSKVFNLFEPTEQGQRASDANFEVMLSVSQIDEQYRATVELLDVVANRFVWSKTYKAETQSSLITGVETKIARELRVRLFGASKAFLETANPKDLSPEALFVLATWVPGVAQAAIDWEMTRIDFARQALDQDPDFGAAHSVLADKLAYLANVYEPVDTAENHAAALFHARRAMELSPLDPDVVFNVAQSHWHSGRNSESRATMARVLELDPGHDLARFLHHVIPYTCAVAPTDALEAAIQFDAALSPDNPIRWLTLTWIGWLHMYREEWEEALAAEEAAARIFEIPYAFMRRAAILNQLDRFQEAELAISRQAENWAGFDPVHYARAAIARLCSETAEPEVFLGYYLDLSDALTNAAKR